MKRGPPVVFIPPTAPTASLIEGDRKRERVAFPFSIIRRNRDRKRERVAFSFSVILEGEMDEVDFGVDCPECKGSGWSRFMDHEDCPACLGSGYEDCVDRPKCLDCGEVFSEDCKACAFRQWIKPFSQE